MRSEEAEKEILEIINSAGDDSCFVDPENEGPLVKVEQLMFLPEDLERYLGQGPDLQTVEQFVKDYAAIRTLLPAPTAILPSCDGGIVSVWISEKFQIECDTCRAEERIDYEMAGILDEWHEGNCSDIGLRTRGNPETDWEDCSYEGISSFLDEIEKNIVRVLKDTYEFDVSCFLTHTKIRQGRST